MDGRSDAHQAQVSAAPGKNKLDVFVLVMRRVFVVCIGSPRRRRAL